VTALANPVLAAATADAAVIVGVEIAAGHDGTAEMVLQVRHENGVTAPVVLDQETGFDLLKACGATSACALVGRPWREIFRMTTLGGA
jgi:hypothetical protein